MSKQEIIDGCYATMENVLVENDLINKPENIFNVDESGINMSLKKGKVVVTKGTTNAHSMEKGSKDHITVNCCINAAGTALPPMIIYNKSFPSSPYKSEGIPGALFAKSANGYMDEELFYTWFSQLFVPRTAHLRKRILFIDGHGSHISLRLIDLAKESNVILFCLPPHTTHLLQPLDVAVFSPLKNHFAKITDFVQIISTTSNELTTVYVNKTNFHLIFKEAFN